MNIICLGDSITAANGNAEKDRWPSALQFMLEGWRPGAYAVYNRGEGGDTTAGGLERMKGFMDLFPALLIVEFGFNDANCREYQTKPRVSPKEFEANLESMGRIARARKGKVLYIVSHLPVGKFTGQGDGKSYSRRMIEYNCIVRRVARRLGAPRVDLPAILKARRIPMKDFLKDGVHVSAAGNRIYAGIVMEAVRRIL